MHTVSDIFAIWRSDADFGRDIGVPYPTVSAWKQRGSIPPAYWRAIIGAARKRGRQEITADLLVDLHARKTAHAPMPGFGEREAAPIVPEAEAPQTGNRTTEADSGHFTRFKHLRRDRFRTLEEIHDHVAALREEWDRR